MDYTVVFILFLIVTFFSYLSIVNWIRSKAIRVLMYHKFSENHQDFLTVTTEMFEKQLEHINTEGYQFITTQMLIDFYKHQKPLPQKPLLLTFDDGYVNNLELAYPILKKFQAKATIFIPSFFVGKTNEWDNGSDEIMTVDQLKSLDPSVFELALHSHTHRNFKHLCIDDIDSELSQNFAFFEENKIPFVSAFAYPYGGRPQNDAYKAMILAFEKQDIDMAFRIGNRTNSLKLNELYAVNRIDIRGSDCWFLFKWKIRFGKL